MTTFGGATATYPEPRPARPTVSAVLRLFGLAALIGLILGPLAGWVWATVANPPEAPLTVDGGLYLGEQALNQQSGVTLWFIVVGGGFGAAAGLAVSWFGFRFGWLTVVAVLALCIVGTVVSRYVGAQVFGPDPQAEAADAAAGDSIQLGVQLDTWVAYLGWPIGGALGALAGVAGWRRFDPPSRSRTLYPHS